VPHVSQPFISACTASRFLDSAPRVRRCFSHNDERAQRKWALDFELEERSLIVCTFIVCWSVWIFWGINSCFLVISGFILLV